MTIDLREVGVALRMTLLTLLLTGLLYPLVTVGAAQLLFPARANGSLLTDGAGHPRGSELVGQTFFDPGYFQARPSAAGSQGYDPLASGGSNLGPTSRKLHDRVVADLKRLRADNPLQLAPVPLALITSSASGLDPDLSPEGAEWQIPRVASSRGITQERLRSLLRRHVEGRQLGFLGEPRVNVLRLNLALDQLLGTPQLAKPSPGQPGPP